MSLLLGHLEIMSLTRWKPENTFLNVSLVPLEFLPFSLRESRIQ